jgi:signal transduction histidine kinase
MAPLIAKARLAVSQAESAQAIAEAETVDARAETVRARAETVDARAETVGARAAAAAGKTREHVLMEIAGFRETLIGMVGHDLRNPLAAIALAANSLVRHGSLNAKALTTMVQITSGADRMGRLIDRLLDFTRARLGGGIPVNLERCDLGEICTRIGKELEIGLSARVICNCRGDLGGNWDADRLAEVVSNIGGNAIGYADPGTAITITAWGQEGTVAVEIANRGVAIATEVLPYIFDPFRRGKPTDASKTRSLGLGLYIAHQLVIAHGGTITARSKDGTTTFAVVLPRFPTVEVSG